MNNIKDSLNELKNNVALSEVEKKNQAETLKAQAETTKQKIQAEISTLDTQTGVDIDRQKAEAQALLDSFNEIMDLYSSIISPTAPSAPATAPNTPTTTPSTPTTTNEEKWFFWKTRDWMWDQWSSVWSGDKRKEQPWTNALRVVWLWVTWYAAYKWVKALWNWAFWDKEEETENDDEETESKSKKKKKSFWKTWWGKFLKWTGIATAAGGWVYLFGKWLHLWWDKEKPTDSDRDQVKAEAYDKFAEKPENKEAVENYETIWENVDVMYNSLYKRELLAGYQDELAMDTISKNHLWWNKRYLWIVPFCLDNKFWTVEAVMEQNTSIKNALAGWIRDMVGYIKGLGNEFLKTFADSYLSKLPSWAWAIWSSLSQKFDNWIASNQEAKLELQFFFRQSIRVQTYLFEKKDQLIDKIASEKCASLWMTKQELLKDDEKYEEYILKDGQYTAFMSSSIANGSNVLKNKWIFDASIWKDVKEAVEKLDNERKDVVGDDIWWKDILQIVNEKKGKNLNSDEKWKLGKACENIIKDVGNNIQDAVKASAWNAYGDLFASDDSALREYREKSWLDEVFNTYKTDIMKNKAAMDRGELTEEQIKALAESVNNMLALKKEAILWRNTIQRDRDEHGNIIFRIPWFLRDSFQNLAISMWKLASLDFMWALNYFTSGYLWAWGVLYVALSVLSWNKNKLISIPAKLWKAVVAAPIKVPLWAIKKVANKTGLGVRMSNSIKYGTSSWIQYRNLFNEASWPADLLDVFKSWERNLAQTSNILKAKLQTLKGNWERFRNWSSAFWWIERNDIKDEKYLREKVFDKLLDDYFKTDLENLRNIKNDPQLYEKLLEHYDTSPAIRKAIKSGRIDRVRTAVTNLHTTIEWAWEVIDTAARRAFNVSIDKAIAKLNEVANPSAVAHHIEQLEALKKDATLVDDEMECFVKFIDEWFDAKLIPEMKKLINISDTFRNGEKIWERLKRLLSTWKYDEFKSILRQPDLSNVFKRIKVDDVLKNFDNVLLKWGRRLWAETAKLLESFFKVLAKVL